MIQFASILKLAEGGDRSFTAQNLSEGVQRDHKGHVGLSIACHVGRTIAESARVDGHLEGGTSVAFSDVADQQVVVHFLGFIGLLVFFAHVFTSMHRLWVHKMNQFRLTS